MAPPPNTLADLSQFFSILSDLKCYRNAFSGLTSLKSKAEGAAKKEQLEKYFLFKLQYNFFSFFFILTPSYFISA